MPNANSIEDVHAHLPHDSPTQTPNTDTIEPWCHRRCSISDTVQHSITSSFPISAHAPVKRSHSILAVAAALGGSRTMTFSTVGPKNKLGEAKAGVRCMSFTVCLRTSVMVRRPGELSHLSSPLISRCKPAPIIRSETVKCLRC